MLSSAGVEEENFEKTNAQNGVISTSSKSSSPFPTPFSLSFRCSKKTTMEEVWKDINLSSLHDHPSREDHHHHHSHTNLGGIILQDFLAGRPSSKDPPPSSSAGGGGDANLFGSPPPPPATMLSLNSGTQFHFLDNSDPLIRPNLNSHLHKHPLPNVMSAFGSPFDALASPVCLPSSGKKRLSESDNNTGGDRRHKRMIKNRESAARSRARKQAYTNELELEVKHLSAENAKLKKQQQQFCMPTPAQLPKKQTLQRTSTAPF